MQLNLASGDIYKKGICYNMDTIVQKTGKLSFICGVEITKTGVIDSDLSITISVETDKKGNILSLSTYPEKFRKGWEKERKEVITSALYPAYYVGLISEKAYQAVQS